MIQADRLRHLGKHAGPIDADTGNCGELGSSFEFEGRASVVPRFELVNSQRALDGIDEPDFADAGSLVSAKFNGLIVAGGTRREDLCEPVGGTAHAARIDLLEVGNDENIGLHYGVDLVVLFRGLGGKRTSNGARHTQ